MQLREENFNKSKSWSDISQGWFHYQSFRACGRNTKFMQALLCYRLDKVPSHYPAVLAGSMLGGGVVASREPCLPANPVSSILKLTRLFDIFTDDFVSFLWRGRFCWSWILNAKPNIAQNIISSTITKLIANLITNPECDSWQWSRYN